jgi:hypothetical protein
MATEISLEPGEHLIFQDGFQSDGYSQPFAFAVTDRAVFVTKEKHFSKESWYFERIPLSRIQQVFLRRERSFWIWTFSALLFVSGLILAVIMMSNALNNEPGTRVGGAPFAMIVCGLIMPFLAKGRKILTVELIGGIYKWKPKLVVDKKSRKRIQNLQEDILTACRSAGIQVLQENKS